jgi:hypothetical protein
VTVWGEEIRSVSEGQSQVRRFGKHCRTTKTSSGHLTKILTSISPSARRGVEMPGSISRSSPYGHAIRGRGYETEPGLWHTLSNATRQLCNAVVESVLMVYPRSRWLALGLPYSTSLRRTEKFCANGHVIRQRFKDGYPQSCKDSHTVAVHVGKLREMASPRK